MLASIVESSLKGSIEAQKSFHLASGHLLIELAEKIASVFEAGGKLFIFGNGGSAADAQHMAAEFVNRFLIDRRPLPALALTTDTSVLTSIGNDFSFDEIFSKQIAALGKKGDLALGISTSGNSANVIAAIDKAKDQGLSTAVLTGGDGGRLAARADICLNVPTAHTPHIQEVHLWAEHLICQLVDQILFAPPGP